MDDLTQTEIGRQIARLNRANAALGETQKYVRYVPQDQQDALQMLGDQVKIALAEAEKDNETIYMLPVPSDLAAPAGKEMVKPTPFETQVPKDDSADLMFQNLIPHSNHTSNPPVACDFQTFSDRLLVRTAATTHQVSRRTTLCSSVRCMTCRGTRRTESTSRTLSAMRPYVTARALVTSCSRAS